MNQDSNSVLILKLHCAPGLCLCSVFSLVEVIIVSSHTSWKPAWISVLDLPGHLPSLQPFLCKVHASFLIHFPQFPSGVSAVDKIGFSPVLEQQNLGGDVLFPLCAGLMTCRNNTAFLHSSALTNIADTWITQKPFLQQMSLGLNTFSLFSAWPHMELLRSSCSQIIPDADRPWIQCSVLYWVCLCWPFPIHFLAF